MSRRAAVGDSEACPSAAPSTTQRTPAPSAHRAVEGAPLTDERTGRVFHPECVVGRAPEDALVRLLGFLALIAVPSILVWAA